MVQESPGRLHPASQPGDVEANLPTVWVENEQKLDIDLSRLLGMTWINKEIRICYLAISKALKHLSNLVRSCQNFRVRYPELIELMSTGK